MDRFGTTYRYADLNTELVEDLQQLEDKMRAETGRDITLIAFAKHAESPDAQPDSAN